MNKIIVLLVMAVLCMAGVVWGAVPMGSAFTYQGGLNDAGEPAEGFYDFEFEVYDALDGGSQQGSTVTIEDANVVDGSFAVKVDFGPDIFTGDARWLEIAVRDGASIDPCDFTMLSPRQELTPAPYALYAKTAGGDGDWTISGSDMYSAVGGNVGIGTTNPQSKLSVGGNGLVNTSVYGNGSYFGVYGKGGSAGVHGIDSNTDSYGRLGSGPFGVLGFGSNYGVHGTGSDYGVYGTGSTYGVWGEGSGTGVYGSGNNYGVHGVDPDTGSYGRLGFDNYGGYFVGDGYFSGNVGIGTPSPSYNLHVIGDIAYTGSILDISDIRLKENIAPLKNGLEKISSLKAIYFNNIGESSDNREVGVIAQDVEKLLPELVSTDKDGFKSVDYTKLTPVLIEAVKELKAENDELQEQNNRLESRLSALENAMRSGSFIGKEL